MEDKIWCRFPPRAPQLSWFEFLLDKSGKLLKEHIKNKNADPSALDLCKQFLQKSIIPAQPFPHLAVKDNSGNGRTKQLRYLALVVAAYSQWNLDKIQECIPLFLQHMLMIELLKNYGISELEIKNDFEPASLDKRASMVWIIFHRWIVRSVVKVNLIKGTERPKSRNGTTDAGQDEQIVGMLNEFLPHSVRILNQCLSSKCGMEVPFPKPICNIMQENGELTATNSLENSDIDVASADNFHVLNESKSSATFDELIPVKTEQIISKISIDLGTLHFFQEDYQMAFQMFDRVFRTADFMQISSKKLPAPLATTERKKLDEVVCAPNIMKEAKGFYIASAMICNIPVNIDSHLEDEEALMFRAEKCVANDFEGLIQVLIEDNENRKLSMSYRQDLESLVLNSQRKDLFFKVMVCNAVRMALNGELLKTSFLSSLKFMSKDEFSFLQKVCADALAISGLKTATKLHITRFFKAILPCLSSAFGEILIKDERFQSIFEGEGRTRKVEKQPQSIEKPDSSSNNSSIIFEEISGYSFKDDPCFIKREIILSTNAEYLKKLVTQLILVTASKDNIIGFECTQYADLLSEIRDPNIQLLLHIYISKARSLAAKQVIGPSLSLLSSALDVLKPIATSQTGRVKNVIHHEILLANVQRELIHPDYSANADTLRRCKACYHRRDQDPLPKKYIYLNIVSYLLNKKEWTFLIEEGGNFEGVIDFIELGYQLAAVSVGLSKAGDAVRQNALQLWNTVISIVCDGSNTKNSLMNFERSAQGVRRSQFIVSRNDLLTFIDTLKNNTVLSVLASCFTALVNLIKGDDTFEVKALYSHIWPTSIELDFDIKIDDVLCVLRPLYNRIITLEPRNIPWLKNRADIYVVEGKYRNAMMQYLEVGAMTSNVFNVPVPFSVWDDQVYQRMIDCCLKEKRFSQVLVLCQFLEPIDYSTVLKTLQDIGSDDPIDTVYDCLWDVTILEFLIYAHSKRGEIEKKQKTIKTMTQPELNSCNSPDTLKQSANQRKSRFLRFLAKSFWL